MTHFYVCFGGGSPSTPTPPPPPPPPPAPLAVSDAVQDADPRSDAEKELALRKAGKSSLVVERDASAAPTSPSGLNIGNTA